MAKKQIIEKYGQLECDRSMDLFNKTYREYELEVFGIHTNLVHLLRVIDQGCIDRDWYEYRFQEKTYDPHGGQGDVSSDQRDEKDQRRAGR